MTGFAHTLRAECAADWQACCQHRFVDELFAGSLDDAHLRQYLVQDYQFIDRFVALLGAAIASADQFAARVTLAQFAAMITSDENTYFIRSFDTLGVPAGERLSPALKPETTAFQALMREAADSRQYANALAVLCVAEGLYLDWADVPGRALPPRFEHAEWITLHANDFFRGFVAWLRSELDRVALTLPAAQQDEARRFFHRAVACERAFFDGVYD
ncbi:TenA family transcriptional regulator [Comamonas serinivorans]|uniref:Aminopyrimidine aminohydrolase n=1 Tax=Comamonas serinivorans TaxID=1082851 RepID=A0A1Y0ER98_9BURK|nr:TenA family protein [Comamonas serinivorans]ARU06028.1 TenA family transcriptional regulator [Comamonas serinivorans]